MDEHIPWWELRDYDFFKMPKDLFRVAAYQSVSPEAKLLYGFVLDRNSLSASNGDKWIDESGDYYVYYTVAEIQERFGCGHEKASKLLEELEKAGLIKRTRKNRTQPYRIVAKPFVVSAHKQTSQQRKNVGHDSGQKDPNNTDTSHTDGNHTDPITPADRPCVRLKIMDNISYDALLEQVDQPLLDGIVDIIVSTICSKATNIRIYGETLPREEIRAKYWALDQMDILYVHHAIAREKKEIRNMRQYILARLAEAKALGNTCYVHWAKLDMAKPW